MLLAFGSIVLINLLGFVIAYCLQSDKLTDLCYALSFLVSSSLAYLSGSKQSFQILLLVLVLLWAIRLGSYLGLRIHRIKRDKRFDPIRSSISGFGGFWFLQTVGAALINSPVIYVLALPDPGVHDWLNPWLGLFQVIVCSLLCLALVYESLADLQKYRFRNDPANQGKFCYTGLWKYSQYPNYAGEIACWFFLALFTLPWLRGIENVFLLSPLFVCFLILKFSGIPPQKRSSRERYGDQPDYQDYLARTPLLLPGFKRGSMK